MSGKINRLLMVCVVWFLICVPSVLGEETNISLTGVVTDENGTPLKGMKAELLRSGLKDITDSDGSFRLTNNVSVFRNPRISNHLRVSSKNGNIHLYLPEKMPVSYTIYELRGRRVYNHNAGVQPQGSTILTFPTNLANGVYYILLHTGEQQTKLMYTNSDLAQMQSIQRVKSNSGTGFRSAVIDTLKITGEGFRPYIYPLATYTKDGIAITLRDDYHLHKNILASTFWTGQGAADENHHISNVPSAWDSHWGDNFGLEDAPRLPRDANFIPSDPRFRGQENPYYFALPYNDYNNTVFNGNDDGRIRAVAAMSSHYNIEYSSIYERNIVTTSAMGPIYNSDQWTPRKLSAENIPWRDKQNWSGKSMVKGRWARIRFNGGDWVYAQWLDAGPYHYDDVEYVFGSARPLNEEGSGMDINPYAGIDLSPSVWLKMGIDQAEFERWNGINAPVDWQFVDDEDVPDGPWNLYVSDNKTNWDW
ncbi:tm1410-like protein [Chitinispirillum alkaliphilum]|nr:tm1410-like protein [Chitinispirillum alkaliphilum]